jgi:hypothetical protein
MTQRQALDDCFIAESAPPGTAEAILGATEAALRKAGAHLLIASSSAGGRWQSVLGQNGYEPVTLFMGKAGLGNIDRPSSIRQATPDDVPDIVAASAEHRRNLAVLNPVFWNFHSEADARFDRWMRMSLTFEDRDMLVAGAPGQLHGYIIAQPVAPLLVPAAHDITGIGVIDDFYDRDFGDPSRLANDGRSAAALIGAAEAAFSRRAFKAAMVVCPAAWTSKLRTLENQGYRAAKHWSIKN